MGIIKQSYCLKKLKQTLHYIFCLSKKIYMIEVFRTCIDILFKIFEYKNENLWTNQQIDKTVLSHTRPWACGTWLSTPFCCFFICILRNLFKFKIQTRKPPYNSIVKTSSTIYVFYSSWRSQMSAQLFI